MRFTTLRAAAARSVLTIGFTALALGPAFAAADAAAPRWTQLSPRTHPTPRGGHAAAYDPLSQRLIVFGGLAGATQLADTWAWDGTNWSAVATTGAPPPRTRAAFAYDEVTHTLVLFGGFNGTDGYLGDTWVFDGPTNTWTEMHPEHAPQAGTGPTGFTDPATGHAVVFGGFNKFASPGQQYQNATWRWNGADWEPVENGDPPGARSSTVIVPDPLRHEAVMFGGLANLYVFDTDVWDGAQWTRLDLATQPVLRFDAAAAFHPGLGQAYLFGGFGNGRYLRDTWSWDGAAWTMVPTVVNRVIVAPLQRENHSMTYFPPTGRIILFGGDNRTTEFSDTWSFGG